MNIKLLTSLIAASSFSAYAAELDVVLADSAWDGKTIPEGQQCQKFGGVDPATPALKISDIPAGTDSIILSYSDRDSERMNNGGHGSMLYRIDDASTVVDIPPVAGHSYELPENFTMLEEHRGANWDKAGAYMPPCSGAKGHAYYLTVKAMDGDNVTASSMIELGKY
ncbi:hypothetical protein [Psychromonas aquatilis]|uniref:PBP family phospholipid-binding protein n=1 Tax=Psychromonas aquatilis TaxID=2005072 RepID=A0ABU9GNS1_9GAMM